MVLGLAASGSSACSILYATDAISSRTGDAGSTAGDDAGAGGASLCGASDFLFCDGFENGFGAAQNERGGGLATVDATHVYRGAFALHSYMPATTPGADTAAAISQSQAWPAHVFARFFAYLPPPWVVTVNLLTYVDPPGNAGLALFIPAEAPTAAVATWGVPNAPYSISSSRTPLGEWVCFEVEVDTVGHRLNVWMNGNALGDLSQTAPLGSLGNLGVGFLTNASAPRPAYEAWFDEIAVDGVRIGCAR
jgi:hypothetical protein